jgi:hypothetical protein
MPGALALVLSALPPITIETAIDAPPRDSRLWIDLQYYCSDAIKTTIFPMFFESSSSEPKSGFANVFTGETCLLGDILTLLVGVQIPAS